MFNYNCLVAVEIFDTLVYPTATELKTVIPQKVNFFLRGELILIIPNFNKNAVGLKPAIGALLIMNII